MARKRPKASGLATSSAGSRKAQTPRRRTRRANENFDGKLSHASPVSPNSKITKYFHAQEDELCSSKQCDDLPSAPMILRTSPRKLLTQANLNTSVVQRKPPPTPPQGLSPEKRTSVLSPAKLLSPSPAKHKSLATRLDLDAARSAMPPPPPPPGSCIASTPHKITSPPCGPAAILPPQSPTSALATLSINSPQSNGMVVPVAPGNKKSKRCLAMVSSVDPHNKVSQARITNFFPAVRRSVRKTKKTVLQEKQKSLEEAVLNHQEDGLEVHMFEGKGRGVVSTRKFHRGEFVVEYAGQLITMEVAREREQLYAQDQNTGCYMYYFRHGNSQYCVDATAESPRLGRLVNHSRTGNLATKTIEIQCEPHLVLIAKEDIEPGTEVTYDYGDRSKESLKYHPWLLN